MNKTLNITETTLVKEGDGTLESIVINSHNSGTVKIYDGTGAGVVAVGTITQSVGAGGKAVHGSSTITSSGASVPATHAVSVFTGSANFLEGVKASAILTSDATQPTAGKVVVVGDITYTFVALGTASTNGSTACNVPLGNTTLETMDNLYNSLLSNPKVNAVKTSAYVITVTAKTVGSAGNSIAATEDDAHLDWDGANTTLTGGVDADTITIGTTVYSAKALPKETTDFLIGTTLTLSLVNLKNVINATNTQVVAVSSDATTLTVRGRVPGTSLNTVATTETCVAGSWADSTLGGGTGASDAGVTTTGALVTIGTTVYTVVDALSETYGADPIAYQVLKGASEATMLDALKAAINGTSVGTLCSTGTVAHPTFIATTNADTTQVIVARTVGNAAFTAAINATATTTGLANTAWTGADITNGTAAQVTSDAATIIINGRIYTSVTALDETSGAAATADQILWVTNEATFLDNLKLAINGTGVEGTNYSTGTTINGDVIATTNGATTQVIQSRLVGAVGNAITTTAPMTNYAWGATTLASGSGPTSELISNTITLSAVATTGERVIEFGELAFDRGLFVEVGGTAADLTIVYK